MESRINYTAVGLFVVLLVIGLAGAAYWLATGGKNHDFERYLIYASDSVSGLNVNSNVLYRGVNVGKVERIRIDPENPERIRIVVDIDANVPIRTDTVAQLRPQGVTGLSMLNLTGGSAEKDLKAKPGQKYPVIPYEPSVFSKLEGGLNETMVTVTRLGKRLDHVLNKHNVQALSETLTNLQQLSQTLADHRQDIGDTLASIREASGQIASVSQGGAKLVDHGDQVLTRLGQVVDGLRHSLSLVNHAAKRVGVASDTTVTFTRAGTKAVHRLSDQTLPDFDQLLSELQGLSRSLTRLVDNLNQNPSQLLYGSPGAPPGPGEPGVGASPDKDNVEEGIQ